MKIGTEVITAWEILANLTNETEDLVPTVLKLLSGREIGLWHLAKHVPEGALHVIYDRAIEGGDIAACEALLARRWGTTPKRKRLYKLVATKGSLEQRIDLLANSERTTQSHRDILYRDLLRANDSALMVRAARYGVLTVKQVKDILGDSRINHHEIGDLLRSTTSETLEPQYIKRLLWTEQGRRTLFEVIKDKGGRKWLDILIKEVRLQGDRCLAEKILETGLCSKRQVLTLRQHQW